MLAPGDEDWCRAHLQRAAILGVGLVLLWISIGRSPAEVPIKLEATVGFQGHVKLGAWAPLRVIVRNRGAKTRGELVIPPQTATDGQEYRLAIEVPPSSRRAFTLYLRYEGATDVRVELRTTTGRRLATSVTCSPHESESRIVVVVSRKSGGLSFLGAVPLVPRVVSGYHSKYDSVVAYVAPDADTGALGLPDHPAGYSGVSAVVLRDVSPVMFTPEEQTALTQWVEAGGLLVIVKGPNVAELRDSFVEDLAPVRIRGQKSLPHLEALARRFRGVVSLQEALVAGSEPKSGVEVLASQNGIPLLARWAYESGHVYFCAADCSAPPLNNADQLLLQMWGEILEDQGLTDLWDPLVRLNSPEVGGVSPVVVRVPIAEWNAFAIFGGFLLAYIVVLVVVSQLVLKKADRREWMGMTTVLLIVAFALGAAFLGHVVRAFPARYCEAAVVVTRSRASVGWLSGVVGIRSPNQGQFSLGCSDTGRTLEYICAGQQLGGWPVHEERGFSVRRVPVDLWGFGAFRVEGPWRMEGQILTRFVALSQQDDTLALTVENQSEYDLERPFLLTPSRVHTSTSIPAGETRSIRPIGRGELRPPERRQPGVVHATLQSHSAARDEPGASAGQRIRFRMLQLLAIGDLTGSYQPYQYGYPGSASPYGAAEGPMVPLPREPILGAWIRPRCSLVDISSPVRRQASEVLLLVSVPVDIEVLSTGPTVLSELRPRVDFTSPGIYEDPVDTGKILVSSGSHELLFELPRDARKRKITRLYVNFGCDRSGLTAEVLNIRTGRWEPLNLRPMHIAGTRLEPPEDYVYRPLGLVRVRVSREDEVDTRVSCTLTARLAASRRK